MQVTEMGPLRALYLQKHRLFSPSYPNFIARKLLQKPKISRQFHHSFQLQSTGTGWGAVGSNFLSDSSPSTSSNSFAIEAVYDPISGRISTKRVKSESNIGSESNSDSESSVLNFGDTLGTRVYGETIGNGKRKESNSGSESSSGGDLSNSDIGDAMGTRVYGEIIANSKRKGAGKGKGKSRSVYVCSSCGHSEGQWWGYCKACNAAGSMKQLSLGEESSGGKVTGFEVSENVTKAWLPKGSVDAGPVRLTDVNRVMNGLDWRIPLYGLFGAEVARVLGGGLVPGSLVLVGGDPGVGKSTLLLQIAAMIAEGRDVGRAAPVVYISGEESIEQIGNRADRMGILATELYLYSSTDIEDILEKVQNLSPRAIFVDSMQTVYLKGVAGSAGSIYQVRECASALLRFAKTTNIPVLLAGHVTKSGDIAGPRVLEHIVDVVLFMEGEKYSSHRLLRSVKNRFGSTDELGVFEMSVSGLQAVSNPSEMFLSEQNSDSEVLAGLAVAAMMDGSRTFVIEIQALCIAGSSIARHVNGVQASRADMIISVLMKQAGLRLQENGIFLNVVSGVNLSETAGDLSIAAAICSSFLEFPIPRGVAFIGEIGLGGELRIVPRMEKRVHTLAKLGYKKCIVPKSADEYLKTLDLAEMKILGCNSLKEMINTVFRTG